MLKELPEEHLKGIENIEIDYESVSDINPNVVGRYRTVSTLVAGKTANQIHIHARQLRSEPKWDERITFFHEVGHHVWFTKLDDNTREDWVAFHIINKESMPSQYGKYGAPRMTVDQVAMEGFAECYAYLKYNPHSCDRKVRKFFTKKWFDPEVKEPEETEF